MDQKLDPKEDEIAKKNKETGSAGLGWRGWAAPCGHPEVHSTDYREAGLPS